MHASRPQTVAPVIHLPCMLSIPHPQKSAIRNSSDLRSPPYVLPKSAIASVFPKPVVHVGPSLKLDPLHVAVT